jgi:elongation factor Ts
MEISANTVKELRERTGAGMMDCKRALTEVGGDIEKAADYLRKKGLSAAAKKAGRATTDGVIGHYVHGVGKLAVLVEVNCETDFVARTEQFQNFVKDIAMHIAAANPICVTAEEMPPEYVAKEKEVALAQLKNDPKMAGKPDAMLLKIIEGKIQKIFDEQCLLNQKFVKNPDQTIAQFLSATVASLGENMTIKRFARWSLGETAPKGDVAAEA